MKALIWKELRENIGWALLAMLALGAAEFYGLHHTEQSPNFRFNDGITLCKKPFLMVTMFGCAAAGLALGFLQVLPELKRDRWAALLHRPVSRGRGVAHAQVDVTDIGTVREDAVMIVRHQSASGVAGNDLREA